MYLEDFGQVRQQQLSSSEESGYDDELMDSEEFAIYNEIHEEEDQITSGYSTISSSKEEAYLSRHIANQKAAEAAAKVAMANGQSLMGLITS